MAAISKMNRATYDPCDHLVVKRAFAAVAVMAACGSALHVSRDGTVGDAPSRLASGDRATIRASFASEVVDTGLWFDDAACRKRFAEPRMIAAPELDDLAGCLAGQGLAESPRRRLPGIAILTERGGLELEAGFAIAAPSKPLVWIGFLGARDLRVWRPQITPAALEALRVAGDPRGYDTTHHAALEAALAGAHAPFVATQFEVCIASDGHVASAHALWSTSFDAYRAFADVVGSWRFRPFELAGQPLAACAALTLAYPSDRRIDTRPDVVGLAPLDPATEGVPIGDPIDSAAGWWSVGPPPPGASIDPVFRVCADEHGQVKQIETYRASGAPEIDATMIAKLREHRYAPAIVDATPRAACTTVLVTFS